MSEFIKMSEFGHDIITMQANCMRTFKLDGMKEATIFNICS